jgi:diguanylate cyclase (GGDEF)-like protein
MPSNDPTQNIPFAPDKAAERTVSVQAVPSGNFVEPVPPCLVVTRGPALGERFELGDSITIGRDDDADVRLAHRSVSRRHCRIWRKRQEFHIADLGATNQTRVNDEPIEEYSLRDGDTITVGEVVLKFLGAGNPENAMLTALHERANRDPLTGVLNRRAFMAALERECSTRAKHAVTLVLLDIDHFKKINDQHGHPVGDLVLKRVTACLDEHVRGADQLARVGGEEFALLLPRKEPAEAAALVETLRAAIEALVVEIDAGRVPVTASFGYAGADEGGVESLYRRADHALYQAKQGGRNRAVAAA